VPLTATWVAPVDLDNCASEPIHVPGAIQPHGALIAVTEPELVVAVVSANVGAWFGTRAADAVGLPLAELIGADGAAIVDRVRRLEWVQRFDEVSLAHGAGPLIATLYRSGAYLVIELERDAADETRHSMVVREAAMALQTSRTVLDVADAAARWVRLLSGFDRVMVYRFDEDWNGEVIAERKRDDLNTFLGLHYPASDIPAQARELYRRNWLRLIPDIGYAAVPLVPPVTHDTAQPLDLSSSTLRSVSPIHVEYLQNMGVGSSMSVSIVINGQLWGLIACHHYSGAHHVSVPARNAGEFLAQLISQRISETLVADVRSRTIELTAIADHVAHAFAAARRADIDEVLHVHEADVLALAGATGLVVRAGGATVRLGATVADDVLDQIIECWPPDHEVLQTNRLGELCPALVDHSEVASGVLAYPLINDRSEFVAWFRRELVQAVDWGGDPHNAKLAASEGEHVRLSPRKSFELWRETIRGRAEPWDASASQAAQRFTRHLGAALLRYERDSASLAKDLQRVMRPDELPAHPGYAFSVFSQSPGRGDIGGDWYDVLAVDDAQIALIVGDVAGHGLVAASEMAQLRNILRAYVAEGGGPAEALERLDRYMLRNLRRTIATVACAVIDTTTSTLRISHAGHVPALLVTPDGADFVPLDGDSLLGFQAGRRTERIVQLAAGDTLALYTDGLVETRRLPLDLGLAALRKEAADVLAGHRTDDPASELATRLLGAHHDDDVTVLLAQRTAGT
jgi:chemotaxis family two-component system sensor kinase Cph1